MKSLFKFKLWWILAFAFIFFAFVVVLQYYQPQPETKSSNPTTPTLSAGTNPIKVKAVICLDISRYDEPLEIKSEFGNPDFVFCHAEFRDVPFEQDITFRWLFENNQVAKIDASVNAGEDVVWSRFNFPGEKQGDWVCEISTKNEVLLAKVPFTVKGYSE